MSWLLDILKNRIFIHQIICMKFSRYTAVITSFSSHRLLTVLSVIRNLNPLKNKSKTLSYIKYHLQRCLYTLVFTSDPSSESFWSWMTDKSSVKWYLENWTLKIISSINIELVRDRRISNNEIGRWKEVTFRSSKTRDIRGHWVTSMEKQSNLRTTRSAEQRYAKQTRRE